MTINHTSISRRSFLQFAFAGSAALFAANMLDGCSSSAPAHLKTNPQLVPFALSRS